MKYIDLNAKIFNYTVKIAQHKSKTISEMIKEQDKPTVRAEESKLEQEMYDELLELLKPEKAPKVDENKLVEEADLTP